MTELEALKLVLRMAREYDFDNTLNSLIEEHGSEPAAHLQTAAIEQVTALLEKVEAAETDPEKARDLAEDVLNKYGVYLTATFTQDWLESNLEARASRALTPQEMDELRGFLVAGAVPDATDYTLNALADWLVSAGLMAE